MKKLITFISFIIIIAFLVMVFFSLVPDKSRDGLVDPTKTPSTMTPLHPESSPITPETELTPTVSPSLTPEVTPTVTPVVTPTEGLKYPELTISSDLNNEDVLVDDVKIGTLNFSIPVIEYPDDPEIAKKINASLQIKALDHIDNFKQECEFLAMDFDPNEMNPYRYRSTSRLCIGKETVSIKMTCEIDYGSAQVEQQIYCYNYSLKDGKEIELYELHIDNVVLIDAIIQSSLAMQNIEFSTGYQNFIREHICNTWYLEESVLYFVYVPFEIASGNYGIVEIPVALNTIDNN